MSTDERPQPPGQAPTRGGEVYPIDHVIAMVADEPSALAAAEALAADGLREEEIHLMSGQELLQIDSGIGDHRTTWNRILALFPSDERQIINEYKAAAARGGFFFAVFAPDAGRRDRVAELLKAHGGHHMHYFSKRTYTDL